MQERRHPHHEFRIQAVAARFALQPVEFEIERPHLDIGEHVDRMSDSAGTHTARSGGTSQRPFGVVTCIVPFAA